MKHYKKYMAVILIVALCSPMKISAEESEETISAPTTDKTEETHNEITVKDTISEYTKSNTLKDRFEVYEAEKPQKEVKTSDAEISQKDSENSTSENLQSSSENMDLDDFQENLGKEENLNSLNTNDYSQLLENSNLNEHQEPRAEQMESEKAINTNVFQVVMPTNTDGIFDFILDPESLINQTNAAAHGGKIFEANSTVFFQRLDGQTAEHYSNKSDFVTFTNKSSIPVDVHLDVQILESSIHGIAMSNDKDFIDDSRPSLYLALIDSENVIPIGPEGVSVAVTIDAAPEGAYEYVHDADHAAYDYKLKEDLNDISFHEYSFQLTGAANEKGDWSRLTDITPEIIVTWTVSPAENMRTEEIINRQQEES